MRIYLASKRRLVISAIVLAVGIAVLLPATALASGRHHGNPTVCHDRHLRDTLPRDDGQARSFSPSRVPPLTC